MIVLGLVKLIFVYARGKIMHRVVRIINKKEEAEDFVSLYFRDLPTSRAKPGQFLMIWVPGVDEIPMSISRICVNGLSSISVLKVGDATNALASFDIGERLGIRGPFGNGYKIESYDNIAMIGGGSGMASILSAIYYAKSLEKDVDIYIGARTANKLPFVQEIRSLGYNVFIATDDGSIGFKGSVIELFEKELNSKCYDLILACGPEKMLYKVALIGEREDIDTQISLERFMKCGVGVCGSCALDGYLVCKDGPVFSGKILLRTNEFGKIRRKGSGIPEKI
ncbi:MAG: dihydroorotate dehydrogenase electron transfer subunit [Thermoprotei archaeon]|nr:MAG: dihydroorotate dehydrogenase electron transfer subunit [Thermoprotei archaeon]